jgi:hypothetical protein
LVWWYGRTTVPYRTVPYRTVPYDCCVQDGSYWYLPSKTMEDPGSSFETKLKQDIVMMMCRRVAARLRNILRA